MFATYFRNLIQGLEIRNRELHQLPGGIDRKMTKRLLNKLVKMLLPWVATVVTALPHTTTTSRFLDRLIVWSENGERGSRT